MNSITVKGCKVKKLHPNATIPRKAYDDDLGYDLTTPEDIMVYPNQITKIRTGIAFKFPDNWGALIRDRSSVATKKGLQVVAGVIDPSYTGEIIVAFYNTTNKVQEFLAGDKIAQLLPYPSINFIDLEEVDDLPETHRASGGFGSTGR
jgi:dUTP pyrophosphatase